MILVHQPTIFGDHVVAGVSSVSDGMMKFTGSEPGVVGQNIAQFTGSIGLSTDSLNYLAVTYEKTNFTQYANVSIPVKALHKTLADGFATDIKGAGLFLPLADCTGAIIYDPAHHALMVSHLGRHSTEQYGALESVEYMAEQFDSVPKDLLVWLGPSPKGGIYPLWARDNMSLIEANRLDLFEAGVAPGHIEVADVDTATDTDYYSHSEFLKGNRTEDGRFAIVAQLL